MEMELQTERWITLKEAAAHLQVSASWLYQKGTRAGVPRTKIGNTYRYRISDLNRWLISEADE
jgi:excisionase family DNA binding protein